MADWSSGSRRIGSSRSHRGQPSVDYGELEEEDFCSAAKERGGSRGRGQRTMPRAIPVATESRTSHCSSAPVNIPDWSKIYRKSNGMLDGSGSGSGSRSYGTRDMEEEEEEAEDEDEDGMVPPHEWIARKLARTQISSSSMCEGIGRTLKGRDLSRVRNAILTKTGFLE